MSGATNIRTVGEFDIRPDPRVLPMLGEINLDLWRCVAELIDNSVDGFLHAVKRGDRLDAPTVLVNLPNSLAPTARVHVRDNGPGMDPDTLQKAVSAGWTGNNPIDNLGLFGMGFNIATARLGSLTRVRTTRAGDREWHVLEIDFDALRRRHDFRTPHIVEPKVDPSETGTEVIISRLKPEQLQALSRTRMLNRIRGELSRTYAAMLRPHGMPIEFRLEVNGQPLRPRNPCTWDHDRMVELSDGSRLPPTIRIDTTLSPRRYCMDCMRWLTAGETSCVSPACRIVERPRRVRGWIGLQRYAHETDYGFDFLRNGRKIEFGVKELFTWTDPDGAMEKDYPIDDIRGNRGRFVGEIHLDHCRVSYDKTRFERSDPAWEEMVEIVKGQGPLQPTKARGFPQNTSPLYRLYQAFRRNQPRNRGGTGWERLLSYPDKAQTEDWVRQFHEGAPEFQDDAKWFELVEAAERSALRTGGGRDPSGLEESGGGIPAGLIDDSEPAGDPRPSVRDPRFAPAAPLIVPPAAQPARRLLPELSGTYRVPGGPEVRVEAFEGVPEDPGLEGKPWTLIMSQVTTRTRLFLADPRNQVFRSATFTLLDALLIAIARVVEDASRGGGAPIDFRDALVSLRLAHAGDHALDATRIVAGAVAGLSELARSLAGRIDGDTSAALFDELSADEKREVLLRMAHRGVTNSAGLLANGGFVEYLDWYGLRSLFERQPQLFFDGQFWDAPYEGIDLGDVAATNAARQVAVGRFSNLIADAARVAGMDPTDLAREGRDELVRAALSVRLLRPDVEGV